MAQRNPQLPVELSLSGAGSHSVAIAVGAEETRQSNRDLIDDAPLLRCRLAWRGLSRFGAFHEEEMRRSGFWDAVSPEDGP